VTSRETVAVFGHEDAEASFRSALASGRLHHAWLLHGPPGIGKATLAFRFARILLGAEEGDSPAGRRVTAGSHADLLVIERRMDEKRGRVRAEIVVDDVQPVQQFLRRTAAEAGWRVVIVDGAEFMNRNAANALLKVLEEPPPRAILLLVSAAPGRLLPTIRSRCRGVALAPLGEDAMRAALAAQGRRVDGDALVRDGQGAPGRALALGEDADGSIAAFLEATLRGVLSDEAVLAQGERIARQEDGFATLCTRLAETLGGEARLRAREGNVRAADAFARSWRAVEDLRRDTDRFNLDKMQAVQMAAAIAMNGRNQAGL